MLLIYEHAEGVFNFQAQQPSIRSPQPIYIPGATIYHANQSAGHFMYQRFQHNGYTLYRSTYMPLRDCTLQVETPAPFVGFRIMLQNHLQHQINQQSYYLLQGQANFVAAPQVNSALHLQKGVIYQVFDMELADPLIRQLQQTHPPLSPLMTALLSGKTVTLGPGPFFVGATVLDMVNELLINPANEPLVLALVQQVIEAAGKAFPERPVTEQQVENLFRVRDTIRNHVASNLQLGDWAKLSGMNITYFKELFKQVFAITPYHYLLYERIKKAKSLLLYQPQLSKSEVAAQCGFSDRNNLRRAFFATEGISLLHWLQLHRIS